MGKVYVVGTADTKGAELRYLVNLIAAQSVPVALIDVGTRSHKLSVDVAASTVAAMHPAGAAHVLQTADRGAAVTAMAQSFERYVASLDDIDGMIGVGGSGGSAIVSAGMHVLPVGVPKVLVSTLASGNVAPYVGTTDVTLMYSVTDIAGLNRVSRRVLANAAHAIVGMVKYSAPPNPDKPAIGLTMFGVTTPCVTRITEQLQSKYDCLVFHATGAGGQAMEKLADSGMLVGVIDATTTEICDHVVGGVLSAGPTRLDAIARSKVPYVGSAGALDMVNFWAKETVPEKFKSRLLYAHTAQVTLMRTTADECRAIGAFIATKLNACDGEVRFLIPEHGVSALDATDQPFHDPIANAALFDTLEARIERTKRRQLIRLPLHINDPRFADAMVEHFNAVLY